MVLYFGRHSSKQCIRNQPIRFGYKVWCLNSVNGYLVNFHIYTGKNNEVYSSEEKAFGKATSPLIHMLDEFPSSISTLPYHKFLDNLFTSFNVLKHLKDNGYNATGTMREYRIPRGCPLPSNKIVKREKRGTCKYIIEHTDGIFICKWVDNSAVTVASTKYGFEPTNATKRYSRKDKKSVIVPQPHCIYQYNKSMGGTDRMDQDIIRYKIDIRGKKWWFVLFTWLIDVAVNNSWLIHKESSGTKIPKLQFCRQLAQTYLVRFKTPIKKAGPSAHAKNKCIDSIRYDRIDHFVAPIENRRRCANKPCSSHVKTICQKCDVGLCVRCFVKYHSI
ncbi:piggyBac transposable element-derived protein 3-like [Belonocnema kinseyi]|uniref:piggyBac transposable element-derived protein 3-like n=1 Tax=Belonocnema kinseyi TaxID=2817044 RepID=UPI00143DB8CC|nr:piggyBac transposable element-derived protein 3-like [Belonocnema kinseyi]